MQAPRYNLVLCYCTYDGYDVPHSRYMTVGTAYTLGGAYVAQRTYNRIWGCDTDAGADAWVDIVDTHKGHLATCRPASPAACWPQSPWTAPLVGAGTAGDIPF